MTRPGHDVRHSEALGGRQHLLLVVDQVAHDHIGETQAGQRSQLVRSPHSASSRPSMGVFW
ncbi:MAG TPA: hypothetical protein VFH30_21155 [Acidimicrobiales bacterium]|nr:hypothetical protein [Acidimicrobiales bacterium]